MDYYATLKSKQSLFCSWITSIQSQHDESLAIFKKLPSLFDPPELRTDFNAWISAI